MAAQIGENVQYTDESSGELLVNGYIYIGTAGLDAKLNPITIYSDRELTTPLANPQRTDSDGRSVNKIWVSGKYSIKVEDSANVQKLNDLDAGESDSVVGVTALNNVQGTNTITATGSPTVSSLINKQTYVFIAVANNTGAMTLKIDSTTAYPVVKNHDVAMGANEIEADQIVAVIWNATDSVFELTSSIAILPYQVGGTDVPITDGGTGASTAAGARTNLGVAIGTDVQAYDASLLSLAALATAADKMPYTTAADTYAEADLTAAGRALLDDIDAEAQRATLGITGLTFISAANPSASATVDFTGIDDTYDAYMFVLTDVLPATDNVSLRVRVGTGATPTWQASLYDYHLSRPTEGSALYAGSVGVGAISMDMSVAQGNLATEVYSGVLMLHKPGSTTNNKMISTDGVYRTSASEITASRLAGAWGNTTAVTGLRFFYSSGNIASGRIALYGVKDG